MTERPLSTIHVARNLVDSIVERIAALVENGSLKSNSRLNSIREAAREYGVSKNTVAEAYDRLVGLGYLRARQGSGYFVIGSRRSVDAVRTPHRVEAVSIVSLLREQLAQDYAVRVGDGRLPYSWMEGSELGTHLRSPKSLRGAELSDGYGSPMGFLPLRERLGVMLSERSITASPSQILLTNGANHALDLLIRHLLVPGDTVLVDTPGYYPLFGKLTLSNVTIVGVRRLENGPDPEDFAAKVAAFRPKIFFTQSLAHNPTGGSTNLAIAYKILKIAEDADLHIVEDDPFADILPPSAPRLAALDQLDRVIYVGSFSKTLSANLRVGYVTAKSEIIAALCDMKMLTIVSSSEYGERLVYNLMVNGQYVRHLRRLRKRTDTARSKALSDLESIGARLLTQPTGGYYLWVELPGNIDEETLLQRASERGIFLAPGSVFAASGSDVPAAMRVNIAHASNPQFLDFMLEQLKSSR
jgi:DNA-binding transcriptional MocR family regulator